MDRRSRLISSDGRCIGRTPHGNSKLRAVRKVMPCTEMNSLVCNSSRRGGSAALLDRPCIAYAARYIEVGITGAAYMGKRTNETDWLPYRRY